MAAAEVEEARLFLEESRRSAASLAADSTLDPVATLDSLLALVKRRGEPDSLDARVRSFAAALAARYGVSLDELLGHPISRSAPRCTGRAALAAMGTSGAATVRSPQGWIRRAANLGDWVR